LINQKNAGPTCQSQAPLKRHPVASLTQAHQLLSHVHRPMRHYPLRAWASKQSSISSPLRSTTLAVFSQLCFPPSASVRSTKHCCWEPLLSPRAPPCRPRLGVRSPSQPPLGADRTPPLHAISLRPTTHHHGEHYYGEIPSSRHPKLEWPGLSSRPIRHRSSATGRPDFTGDHLHRGRGERSPVLRCRGPKGLVGLMAHVDKAQWHTTIFSFPFGLFISTFKLGFKLLKFIGNWINLI
jgi:hypothetical protein